ncbi:hydroxylamine oxidation protein HaoB [Methylacidiphilum caldifontis]|uniref:hydroxylamine oxidation protein HaoB n=1 Tax=Methylacidiphilum caldifontis TaxID=2795386 RepID=UPI001F5E077F|nr:hydroxylamine oxidation protein HaoB [Methylacidiphilum caldifontis]
MSKLNLKIILGLVLLIGGILLVVQSLFVAKRNSSPPFTVETKEGKYFSVPTFFPILKYFHYTFSKNGDFWIAHYLDEKKKESLARIYPPKPIGTETDDILCRLWEDLARVVSNHAPPNSLFIGWWDISQRLKLFTGQEVWIENYDSTVIPQKVNFLFEEIFGAPLETGKLAILAKAYNSTASEGLEMLKQALPKNRALFVCVSAEDISNLALAFGKTPYEMGFEMRIFPLSGSDIHGSIPTVMKWVNEKQSASFFLQQLPTQAILAWRADKRAQETLLGRLLPLTSSLKNPLAGVKLLYQSTWGGYIQIYKIE